MKMEDYLMALGLFNESKSLNHRTDDWEQDITRLQRRAELYDRRQAIKAIFAQIVKFFSRPTMALRAARV
jgi:hypothetical protein